MSVTENTAVLRDMRMLAPRFAAAVADALNDCWRAGLDPVVFEAWRTEERQAWLYAQGRTRSGSVVTNASSALTSWHGYGLAVDVISRAKQWDAPTQWWHDVAERFEARALVWGGRWKFVDLPHFQWGAPMRSSPSPRARELLAQGGVAAVWREVGAA